MKGGLKKIFFGNFVSQENRCGRQGFSALGRRKRADISRISSETPLRLMDFQRLDNKAPTAEKVQKCGEQQRNMLLHTHAPTAGKEHKKPEVRERA